MNCARSGLERTVLHRGLWAVLGMVAITAIVVGAAGLAVAGADGGSAEGANEGQRADSSETKGTTELERKTVVSIEGRAFHINGKPTYEGRNWRGHKIEGLLMNSRMVQGTFDDLNKDTRHLWKYPDGAEYSAERNNREFVEAMPLWRKHGLLGIAINLQGGSPQGYSRHQPWHNSSFEADGSLRPEYMQRMERIIDKADELGMVVILGFFYFGQDQHLADEAAVLAAVDNVVDWLLERKYTNVLIEIGNEVNHPQYDHKILGDARNPEFMERVRRRSQGKVDSPAKRLLVSTSLTGGKLPSEALVEASDFVLLHGNGVGDPQKIAEMVRKVRAIKSYRDQPILFNEDDHFDFDKPANNFASAVSEYAGWGYFDYRMKDEGFDQGYQSVPVNWGISSERKKGFFKLLAEITGADAEK